MEWFLLANKPLIPLEGGFGARRNEYVLDGM